MTEVGVFAGATVLMGRLGSTATAAHQIALGLAGFTSMVVVGMGNATAVRVGYAIGARQEGGPRRAALVGLGLGVLFMTGSALVFIATPRLLARLFSSDSAVVDVAEVLVRIAAVFQIADGVQVVAAGALRGAADTRFSSIANAACHWGVGLPLAVLLGFHFGYGAPGVWWGLSLGLFCIAIVLLQRFARIFRRPIAAI
jgi:MATE family multidrug resistance protein